MRPTDPEEAAVVETAIPAVITEVTAEVVNERVVTPTIGKAGLGDLSYRILGVDVAVHSPVAELRALVQTHWGSMSVDRDIDDDPVLGHLTYSVSRSDSNSEILIDRPGQPTQSSPDEGEFLYALEVDSTIAVQRIRKDLYFLHAAVAEVDGKAYLLVAKSGGGKSTTLWGLLHHGWRYLSDELAPIDLSTMCVQAYPRALSLKRHPPAYPLPEATLETPRTLHVPVEQLPAVSKLESCPLAAAYFVNYRPDADAPRLQPMGAAEAGARLYANALNQLAHPNAGLDAAVQIAKSIPSFSLESADLAETCALVAGRRS